MWPSMALFTSMFANKALSVRAEGQPTHDAHLEGEKTIQKAVNRCVWSLLSLAMHQRLLSACACLHKLCAKPC